jgi:hypothetical protein
VVTLKRSGEYETERFVSREKAKRKLSPIPEVFYRQWQLPKGANVQNRKELNEGTGQTKVEAPTRRNFPPKVVTLKRV